MRTYRLVGVFAMTLSLWAQTPVPVSPRSLVRTAVHSQEFVADPTLSAGLRQTSLMDLSPNVLGEPLARYQLEAGDYKFCTDPKDPLVTGMTVLTDSGTRVAQVNGDPQCQKVSLPKGFYRIQVHGNLAAATSGNKVAFLHADLPSVPLVGPNGATDGFWMMIADPSVTLNGHAGHPLFTVTSCRFPAFSVPTRGVHGSWISQTTPSMLIPFLVLTSALCR